jgi:Putative beta barrel porin-7 (BBP7)
MNSRFFSAAVLLLALLSMPALGQDGRSKTAFAETATPAAPVGPPESFAADTSESPFAVAWTNARLGAPAAVADQTCHAADTSCVVMNCCDDCGYCGFPTGRAWISAEYLLWWTKGDRLPPLLTTSPPGTPLADAGVIGRPGTTVLFGDDRVNDDVRSGGRFTGGFWLNRAHATGIEASFFFLEEENTSFSAASSGIPILARPFFDVLAGQNNSLKIAYPGLVSGSFFARETSELLGTDIYLRQNICCGCCSRVDLLAGYRFLSLSEGLNITEIEIATSPNDSLFGIPIFINEGFDTKNRFHGGEIGFIAECARDEFFVRFIGKLALGGTSRTVSIHGGTRVDGFPADNGGLLALPSNIGQYHSTEFSVVPELGIQVGCQVTERLRVMAGYSFLYWTNVARPGDEIDLAVNTSQPPLGDRLVGQARPGFLFRDSDYWAHGFSFGVEFRY